MLPPFSLSTRKAFFISFSNLSFSCQFTPPSQRNTWDSGVIRETPHTPKASAESHLWGHTSCRVSNLPYQLPGSVTSSGSGSVTSSRMGKGEVKTRSGYNTQAESHQKPSRCKAVLKAAVEVTRDLSLLLFYVLPDPTRSLRLYFLLFLRLALYCFEGLVVYALTATILAGETTTDPGMLVELTRMILCHTSDKLSNKRTRRSVGSWQDFLLNVNTTHPDLANIWEEFLTDGFSNTSANYFNNTQMYLPSSTSESPSTIPETTLFTTTIPETTLFTTTIPETTLFTTTSTEPALPYSTSENSTNNLITHLFNSNNQTTTMQGYHVGLCLDVNDLQSKTSTMICTSALDPFCLILTLLMFAIVMAFSCGRTVQRESGSEERKRTTWGEAGRRASNPSPESQH